MDFTERSPERMDGAPDVRPEPLAELLRAKVNQFARLLERYNLPPKADSERGWIKFLSAERSVQESILDKYSFYTDFCELADRNDYNLLDSRQSLKWATLRLRIRVPSDFESALEKEDIIEIFNEEGIQIFRNLSFFDITDYSLLELLTHEWYELYGRSDVINARLGRLVGDLIEGKIQSTSHPGVPPHLMEELLTENRKVQVVTLKNLAPTTYLDGRSGGFAVSSTAALYTQSDEKNAPLMFR